MMGWLLLLLLLSLPFLSAGFDSFVLCVLLLFISCLFFEFSAEVLLLPNFVFWILKLFEEKPNGGMLWTSSGRNKFWGSFWKAILEELSKFVEVGGLFIELDDNEEEWVRGLSVLDVTGRGTLEELKEGMVDEEMVELEVMLELDERDVSGDCFGFEKKMISSVEFSSTIVICSGLVSVFVSMLLFADISSLLLLFVAVLVVAMLLFVGIVLFVAMVLLVGAGNLISERLGSCLLEESSCAKGALDKGALLWIEEDEIWRGEDLEKTGRLNGTEPFGRTDLALFPPMIDFLSVLENCAFDP